MTQEITVIVPTLWAAPGFDNAIAKVADAPAVLEVIVVDNNAQAGRTLVHPKIRMLRQRTNIFVNPAWNLGAREARGSILCFLNDDLAPRPEAFEFCLRVLKSDPSVGLVGLKWDEQLASSKLQLHELDRPDSPAFGCMMFMRACDYRRIPGVLKIWHGDDFLFTVTNYRGLRVMALSGFADAPQPRSISTNAISKEVSGILKRDAVMWNRWVKRLLLMRYRPMDATSRALDRVASELRARFMGRVR